MGAKIILEKLRNVGGRFNVGSLSLACPVGFSEGFENGVTKPNTAGGVVLAQPDGNAGEHLINVLVRVSHDQKRRHCFSEHEPRDQKGHVTKHIPALALFGGVVQLEI